MAKMIDAEPAFFEGERQTYIAFKERLPSDIICYYNREVNGLEFDFCLLIKNLGLIVVEVKGWKAKEVFKVEDPNHILLLGYDEPQKSPKQQARSYRFALRNLFLKKYGLNLPIADMVCYPFMSENDYLHNGLRTVSEPELTLFAEDLADQTKMSTKLLNAFAGSVLINTDSVSGHNYDSIRSHFESEVDPLEEALNPYSVLRIIPDGLSLADIERIFTEYQAGTKQVIFVSSETELQVLAKNLNNTLDSKHVSYINGSLYGNSLKKNAIAPKNGRLSCFIFEAFSINDLADVCPSPSRIENGQMLERDVPLLRRLASLSSFNVDQFFVEHADPKKNIQITAGAGTGKTYSMISRISFLVDHSSKSGVFDAASEIAMLTFTVDAATNMKTRIKTQFMNYFLLTRKKCYLDLISDIERMRISTIHSFAKEIIQNTSIPLGIGSDFTTISGTFEKRRILVKNLNAYLSEKRQNNPDLFYLIPIDPYKLEETISSFVERLYNKGCDVRTVPISCFGTPAKGFDYINDFIEKVIQKTELEYAQYLLDNNAVSLNQYMIHLNTCIDHESFNPNNWPFKIVFIDEFQDVDDGQIRAFRAMQEKLNFKFFIVGDLKQSIYRFRGATLDAFTAMVGDGHNWVSYSLQKNYRSEKSLLERFEESFDILGTRGFLPYGQNDVLIGVKDNGDPNYKPIKKLTIDKNANCELSQAFYDQIFETATNRCKEINSLLKNRNLNSAEKTVAILVRTNAQIGQILYEARKRGITVYSDTNISLYKLQPALDLCKLTSALCNPYDPVSLFDLIVSNNINCQFPVGCLVGLDETEKTKLLTDCLDQCLSAKMHCKWIDLVKRAKAEPVLKVLHEIYDLSKPWLNESKNVEKQLYYRTNYELLFEDLSRTNKKSYLTLDSINESLTISITTGFQSNSREIVEDFESSRIVCVTIHGSKGLEYDTVILPFTNDQIIRLKRNAVEVTYVNEKIGYYIELSQNNILTNEYFITENEIQEIAMEESRILYVAMTRAINHFVWVDQGKNDDKITWATFLEALEHAD